ncbi:N-acetyl-gamma-glutamyl-phosphate reductase [Persephonella hydrogeniphila]|uniref:N-acetyl-gamma-glutamyl-phosphate reductase n=1 Tax=Persephonella hydrogeniphila TaxID=198703 RepID=A0A285NEK6_9AQUI|nr:N-acetyl-gamma-glutamyl-phosphate reductase [Persephonella hydrogeniphila]SNZ07944.1 N-acetyl-gamma-glutamyl-phosphate reductase [Persephonella hydrogeniphila]
MKVSIVGASGYTGVELIRYLSFHKDVEIAQIVSRQFSGKKLSSVFPHFSKTPYEDLIFEEDVDKESFDIYFLCLPHEPSVELVKELTDKGKKVIDLSAAYRIKDIHKYPEYYGFEHRFGELLDRAVYGLPEIFRKDIEKANLVANPGCYPTATLLALYPGIKEEVVVGDTVVVNALSGISGAGRSVKQHFHYPEAYGNAYAYNPTKHRHTPEMEDVIKRVTGKEIKVRFTPHIIPVSRGMISTVVFNTNLRKEQLVELYRLEYRYEPFVRIVPQPPQIKNVVGSNFCDLYVDLDERTGQAVIISAIDNLGKGASSQAVQNMNIMTGLPEDKYLKTLSEISILFP